jgi:hypothetical protein
MTPETDAVLDLIARWTRTERTNDPEALSPLLAEGFVGVGPLGFVLSRDQWLHRFAGGLHNRDLAVSDPELHHHGTAAVVVGVLAQDASYQGKDSSGRFRVTLTVVTGGKDWRLASVHLGLLPHPTPAGIGEGAGR